MAAFDHLRGDHLLADTCTWEARTGETEDASYDDADAYAAPATLACLANQPSSRWYDRWPLAELTGALELVLPHDATVAPRDRVTYAGQAYRIKDVANWAGAGVVALVERVQGVT
jgi:hypothetical protein